MVWLFEGAVVRSGIHSIEDLVFVPKINEDLFGMMEGVYIVVLLNGFGV